MRTNTLAILGLVAATQALPAREKRQFIVADPDTVFCVNNECSGNGLIFAPSPKLPPSFGIGKRTPQHGRGGNKGGKGDDEDKWGKPDDPWAPVEPEPWNPEDPDSPIKTGPPVPEETPKEPDYPEPDYPEPDYPEEEYPEPDYPEEEYPEPDYPEEEYPEPDYPEEEYPEPDYPEEEYPEPEYPEPEPDYPEEEYPEDDYPDVEVSREDIIEAEQTVLLLQQVVLGVTDPEEKAAIQAAIDEAMEFLRVHAGITHISADPGVGTIFVPELPRTRRSTEPKVDVEELYKALVTLLKSKNPSFPVYMVAEQLVQLLLEEGFEFEPTILGNWSKLNPKAKRQDGIFALPGSCKLEDIIGLETTLATILLIYGPDPPASISSLRNAVTAALNFCRYAEDPDAELTIPDVDEGAPVVPEVPVEGGGITIEEPVEGDITIEEPSEGSIEIEEPEEGSVEIEEPEEETVEPERPTRGPPVEIEVPEEGEVEVEEGEESTFIVEEPEEGSIEINEA